jgi:oligopeptide transport system ATP-binding protein
VSILEHEISAANVLEVKDLTKTFHVSAGASGTKELRALDGINLSVRKGETLGLVGESGCGKSTLARTLMMLEQPDSGTVSFDGQDPFALRGKELLAWRRRVQMVFQDPFASLNSRMTAGQIISEPFATHKDLHKGSAAKNKRLNQLLDLVGLRSTDASKSPQEFSGGQRQRIGIARALALDPDLIILDEPVSALDLSVQAQVLNLLNELQQELGVSYIFISHDLSVVRHVTDRVAVMYLGRIIETGSTEQVFDSPLHPYTASLMSASPKLDPAKRPAQRIVLQGELPSPLDPPSGCRFRTRCWKAQPICTAERPPTVSRDGAGQILLGMPGIGPDSGQQLAECHFPVSSPAEAGLVPAG